MADHVCLGALCKCKTPGRRGGPKADKTSRIKKDVVHNKDRATSMEGDVAAGYKEAGFPKARRVPMSGAISTLPADVDPGELLLVECKMTRGGNLTIDRGFIRQIRQQSIDAGRGGYYALHAWALSDAEGETRYTKTVLVDEALWLDVLKQLKFAEKELGIG